MKIDVGGRNSRKDQPLQKPLQRRRAQLNGALVIDAWDHLRKCESDSQRRNQEHKSRQRPATPISKRTRLL